MSPKHKVMEQHDGMMEVVEDDQLWIRTQRYWTTGILGTVYQTYIDVLNVIEESCLDEESKQNEKDQVLDARKKAFGDDYRYYPPWRKF